MLILMFYSEVLFLSFLTRHYLFLVLDLAVRFVCLTAELVTQIFCFRIYQGSFLLFEYIFVLSFFKVSDNNLTC